MVQVAEDWSDKIGQIANNTTPTGIVGWTFGGATGGQANQSAEIVADVSAPGGAVCRLIDTGWASYMTMYNTLLGNYSGATEVLTAFRVNNLTNDYAAWGGVKPTLPRIAAGLNVSTGVGFRKTGAAIDFRAWYFQGSNDWASIGLAQDVSADYAAGEIWWVRDNVDVNNEWRYRFWEDGIAEPTGTWAVEDVLQATLTGGFIGFGLDSVFSQHQFDPVDIIFIGIGTDGDPAPLPTPAGVDGSGAMVALPATLSGQGFREVPGSGILVPQSADLSGTAVRVIGGNGTLAAAVATLTGSGVLQVKLTFAGVTNTEFRDENGVFVTGNFDYEWYDKTTDTDGDPTQDGVFFIDASGEAVLQLPLSTLLGGQAGTLLVKHPTIVEIQQSYTLVVG